jgi:hypothetical protein
MEQTFHWTIPGNKKDNLTVIYTLGGNLKVRGMLQYIPSPDFHLWIQKSGDMAVGQVSFHSDKKVR